MCPAFCDRTREVLIGACRELGLGVHDKGTMVTIEGPRFSSLAESRAFRSWGCDVINMTTVPEVGSAMGSIKLWWRKMHLQKVASSCANGNL